MSETKQTYSIGQEIMRTQFSKNDVVGEWKQRYAKLFDDIVDLVAKAQLEMDTPPSVHATETIQRHMELCRRNEDAIRCWAEASKILETSCMYLVKGLSA